MLPIGSRPSSCRERSVEISDIVRWNPELSTIILGKTSIQIGDCPLFSRNFKLVRRRVSSPAESKLSAGLLPRAESCRHRILRFVLRIVTDTQISAQIVNLRLLRRSWRQLVRNRLYLRGELVPWRDRRTRVFNFFTASRMENYTAPVR